jgi:hypothetical protein
MTCLAAVAPGFAAEVSPRDWNARFHQDLRVGDFNNPNLKPIGEPLQYEAPGARITLPAGQGTLATTGLATIFKLHGDFEVTLAYEVLKAAQPKTGYGVGVAIYAAIDTDTGDAVSLSRRVEVSGKAVFKSDRMTPADGGPKHKMGKPLPSAAPAGQLRLSRQGSKLRFLVSEGARPDVMLLNEVDFGTADVRWLQVAGDAGDSDSALDLRLLELTVLADELPGLIDAPEQPATQPVPAIPPRASAPATTGRRNWWIAAGVGGAVVVCSLALGTWLIVRRTRRKGQAARPIAKAEPGPVSFACSGCGRKLRVKAELAGKKVKCPGCGRVAGVPPRGS